MVVTFTGHRHPDNRSLDEEIASSQRRHIRHAPIPVPVAGCPFRSEATIDVFMQCLGEVSAAGIVPEHYGLREAEWPEGGYGEHEYIALGRQRRRVTVDLPFTVWWPRAVLWAQGLEIMSRLILAEEDGSL